MTRELNNSILHLEIPDRMKHLRISDTGYPVPRFVPWIDGKPEFRGFDPDHMTICVRHKRCWLCAQPLGKFMAFVLGPMCCANRNTAEPPCHYECARYSVSACPFLTQPRMRRNEKDMPPPEERKVAGTMISRNPGVVAIWVTTSYRAWRPRNGGVLFDVGDPERVEFYAEGRKATREEVLHSMETGLPLLMREAEKDGPEGVAALNAMYAKALELVPA